MIRLSLAAIAALVLSIPCDAGMYANYDGSQFHDGSCAFNFAVSSTTPTTLGSSPNGGGEPMSGFFPLIESDRLADRLFDRVNGFGGGMPAFSNANGFGGRGMRGNRGRRRGNRIARNVSNGASPVNGGRNGAGGATPNGAPNGLPGLGGGGFGNLPGGAAGGEEAGAGAGEEQGGFGEPMASAVPEPGTMAIWGVASLLMLVSTRGIRRSK